MRRSRTGSTSASAVLMPMIDVLLLSMMVMMLHKPIYDARVKGLPPLKVAPTEKELESSSTPGHVIRLTASGSFFFDDEPVQLEQIPSKIQQKAGPDGKIRLDVETKEGGTGNLTAFLEMQSVLSERKIWNRMNVLYRPRKSEEAK